MAYTLNKKLPEYILTNGNRVQFESLGPKNRAIVYNKEGILIYTGQDSFTVSPRVLAEEAAIELGTEIFTEILPSPPPSPDIIQILGTITDDEGNRIPNVDITVNFEDEENVSFIQSNDKGSYQLDLPGTYGIPKNIKFESKNFLPVFKSKLTKSGQSTNDKNEKIDIYQINITLKSTNIDLSEQQAELQIKIQEVENIEIEVSNFIKQPNEIKLTIILNKLKENLKRTLFPFILSLLAPFGTKFVQALLDRIPNAQPDSCPDSKKIKEIIEKRNRLVRQLNQIYNVINVLSKVLQITNVVIQALQLGINTAKNLPTPPFAPSGAVASAINKIELRLEVAGIAVNVLTVTSVIIGIVLQTIIDLLNNLDLAIQQCSEDQNIPFEEINDELNALANQTIEETQNNNLDQPQSYKGFTFEIKLDEVNTSKYPKRYAQALNIQEIPVLRSDSSFASNPQVLIDQLKFIIDTQNLRGD